MQRFRLTKLSIHRLPRENGGEGYEEFEKTFKSERRTQSSGRTASVLNGDRQEEAGFGARLGFFLTPKPAADSLDQDDLRNRADSELKRRTHAQCRASASEAGRDASLRKGSAGAHGRTLNLLEYS